MSLDIDKIIDIVKVRGFTIRYHSFGIEHGSDNFNNGGMFMVDMYRMKMFGKNYRIVHNSRGRGKVTVGDWACSVDDQRIAFITRTLKGFKEGFDKLVNRVEKELSEETKGEMK